MFSPFSVDSNGGQRCSLRAYQKLKRGDMKHKYLIALITINLLASQVRSQSPAFRGIYLDKFSTILGNTVKEDSVLQYAADSSFNYIALYDLQSINFSNSTSVNKLANFIRKAHQVYGIASIGAVGESYSTFQSKIGPYNSSRTNVDEKFNVFNLEFEFWTTSSVSPGGNYCVQYLQPNGCSCDSSGGFKFFITNMHLIDSLATVQGATSETYLGWFNQGQGSQIQRNVKRILLHAYRVDPSSVYGYSKSRLQYLASNNSVVNVAPIFSSEPIFMGPWLNSHQQNEAYTKYKTDFQSDVSSFVPYINMLGYQWFDFGYMPKPVPGAITTPFTPTITATATSFCQGESATITAGGGTAYTWSNGETTASITVNNSGSYSCQVTNNGVTQTTTAVSVVVNTPPTSSIAQGIVSNYQLPLTSTNTAGSGTITSYQWKFNNSTIANAISSSYTATTSGDYSLVITNSNGCTATSNIQNCSVPIAPICILTTPGTCTSVVETNTTARIFWGTLPTSDSILIRYKPDQGSSYFYITIPNTGQNNYLITELTPNTRYQWRIKTTCGTTSSSYSQRKYFYTLPNNTTTQFAVTNKTTANTKIESANNFMVYPNPASASVNISYFSEGANESNLNIVDINGRLIKTQRVQISDGDNTINIETENIESGIYFVQIRNEQDTEIQRLIIEK